MMLTIARILARGHWVILLIAAPLLLFVTPRTSPILLVVPGLWLAAWVAEREALPRTPLNVTLLLLACMVLVSTWATYDLAISLPKISGMVLGLGIFFAVAREGRHPRAWWLCFLLFLGLGLGVAALGFLGTPWGAKFGFLSPITARLALRVTGVPGAEEGFNPNYVAGALLWVIPTFVLLLALLILNRRELLRGLGSVRGLVFLAAAAMGTLGVIGVFMLGQSRGGYLAFAVTSLALIAMALPSRPRRLYVTLLGMAVVVFVLQDWLSGSRSLVQVLLGGTAAAADATVASAEGRMEIWSRAIYGIQDFPFTGMGMNTFRHIVQVLYPLFLIGPDTDIGHAHNEFLQAALDLGIPGLVAFVALYLGAFWMLWGVWGRAGTCCEILRSAQNDSKPNQNDSKPDLVGLLGRLLAVAEIPPVANARLAKGLVLGLGGGLFAHMVWGLTDAMALGSRPGFLFWVILGLVAGLHGQSRGFNGPFESTKF